MGRSVVGRIRAGWAPSRGKAGRKLTNCCVVRRMLPLKMHGQMPSNRNDTVFRR